METLRSRLETLTPREREVFQLVVTGMLNKQVAFDLGTTEKTIKVHRGRVMEKMGAQSLADLVRFAEKLGIRSSAN
jgi:FixJ family two-component response regulator